MSVEISDARQAAADWDTHALDYARLFSPLTGHIGRTMVSLVSERLPEAPKLLDIACGPGDLAAAAARLCEDKGSGSVLATDISPAMVELTGQTLSRIEAHTSCEVRNGEMLGVNENSFDVAFSCFGIFLFNNRIAGWREAVRALKPGGFLVTSVWRGPEHNELARGQMKPLMAALPKRLTETQLRPTWAHLMTSEGLQDEVANSVSVIDVEMHVVDATIAIPKPIAMWRAMVGNPVTRALINQCTPHEKKDVERAVLSEFEKRAGGSDRPLVFHASSHILIARRTP